MQMCYAILGVGRLTHLGNISLRRAAMRDLRELEEQIQTRKLDPMTAKEHYFRSQTSSRSQRDHRTQQ